MEGIISDWGELFLSSAGRISRGPFLLASTILIAIATLYQVYAGPVAHWITGWVVYPLLVFCAASVLSKRFHDRGGSGWWSALVLLAMLAVWPHPVGRLDFLFCLVLAWVVIDLGLTPGERGANAYGPAP